MAELVLLEYTSFVQSYFGSSIYTHTRHGRLSMCYLLVKHVYIQDKKENPMTAAVTTIAKFVK